MDTEALLVGLAELLAAEGVGVWRTDGVFAAGETAVVVGVVPPSPDRCVTLDGPYLVDDAHGGPMMGHELLRVQVRTRGVPRDPLGAHDLEDAVYRALHGRTDLVLGGVRVAWVRRVSVGVMGSDGDHREERSSNYELSLDNPTAYTV